MHWLRGVVVALVCGSWVAACSSGASSPGEPEAIGSKTEAITTACNQDTIGLPCDPDGPAGPKLECEGACGIATSGLVACQTVSTGSLDGIICGTTNGVGNAACKRYCSGRTCLNANAPSGAACRPTALDDPCDGACNGSGVCQAVASACDFGRIDQLCKFETCNFTNATACVTRNLRSNTICSDADACSIGRCDTGVCEAGPTMGCDDGNACTDDTCDPGDGGCTGTPDNTNTCSDGNACTVGDACSSGGCVPGTGALDCDDNNLCTTDSCDPNTGCAHVPKSCSDGDACTDDVCAPNTGLCSYPVKTCADADACTTDTCNSATGCVFTPLSCDDADACTTDSCSVGVCQNGPLSCDDLDPCTLDSCSAQGGCAHAAIAGCGAGGAGAGGEPGTGEAGNGGVAGEPATSGGAPGAAGAGDAGAPAAGGFPGSEGGAPDEGGGAPGSAGSPVQGGSTSGSSGAATAGTANVAGNTSGGSANPQGGEGGIADPTGRRTVQDGGCGCRVPASSGRSSFSLAALAVLGLALARRDRRASRAVA